MTPDEIQRLFYDLQVYQIELEMQNDELAKTQHELEMSRNRFHFLHHHIPVGIITVNHLGFIEDSNDFFCQMLDIKQFDIVKKHLTALIKEEDKNQIINRFDAFFKSPEKKSIKLHMHGNLGTPIYVKLMGKQESNSDFDEPTNIESNKLIITVTDISDTATKIN